MLSAKSFLPHNLNVVAQRAGEAELRSPTSGAIGTNTPVGGSSSINSKGAVPSTGASVASAAQATLRTGRSLYSHRSVPIGSTANTTTTASFNQQQRHHHNTAGNSSSPLPHASSSTATASRRAVRLIADERPLLSAAPVGIADDLRGVPNTLAYYDLVGDLGLVHDKDSADDIERKMTAAAATANFHHQSQGGNNNNNISNNYSNSNVGTGPSPSFISSSSLTPPAGATVHTNSTPAPPIPYAVRLRAAYAHAQRCCGVDDGWLITTYQKHVFSNGTRPVLAAQLRHWRLTEPPPRDAVVEALVGSFVDDHFNLAKAFVTLFEGDEDVRGEVAESSGSRRDYSNSTAAAPTASEAPTSPAEGIADGAEGDEFSSCRRFCQVNKLSLADVASWLDGDDLYCRDKTVVKAIFEGVIRALARRGGGRGGAGVLPSEPNFAHTANNASPSAAAQTQGHLHHQGHHVAAAAASANKTKKNKGAASRGSPTPAVDDDADGPYRPIEAFRQRLAWGRADRGILEHVVALRRGMASRPPALQQHNAQNASPSFVGHSSSATPHQPQPNEPFFVLSAANEAKAASAHYSEPSNTSTANAHATHDPLRQKGNGSRRQQSPPRSVRGGGGSRAGRRGASRGGGSSPNRGSSGLDGSTAVASQQHSHHSQTDYDYAARPRPSGTPMSSDAIGPSNATSEAQRLQRRAEEMRRRRLDETPPMSREAIAASAARSDRCRSGMGAIGGGGAGGAGFGSGQRGAMGSRGEGPNARTFLEGFGTSESYAAALRASSPDSVYYSERMRAPPPAWTPDYCLLARRTWDHTASAEAIAGCYAEERWEGGTQRRGASASTGGRATPNPNANLNSTSQVHTTANSGGGGRNHPHHLPPLPELAHDEDTEAKYTRQQPVEAHQSGDGVHTSVVASMRGVSPHSPASSPTPSTAATAAHQKGQPLRRAHLGAETPRPTKATNNNGQSQQQQSGWRSRADGAAEERLAASRRRLLAREFAVGSEAELRLLGGL